MARPRRYTTDTERRQAHAQSQRTYRRRQAEETVLVDRQAITTLLAAVDAAAAAGDPVARQVRTATADGLLRNLGHHFRLRAAALDASPAASGRPADRASGRITAAAPRSG